MSAEIGMMIRSNAMHRPDVVVARDEQRWASIDDR
jgi:hypothetical protein